MRACVVLLAVFLTGCAGFTVPFTDHKAYRWMFQSGHDTLNSDCIEFEELKNRAHALETQHLSFLVSKNPDFAVDVYHFKKALGEACQPAITKLTTGQIQTELFGSTQNVPNPEKLRELGGLLFEYQDITTDSGVKVSLHLEQEFMGPDKRLIAIYTLKDGKIIHFLYSGKDDVNRRKIYWPVAEIFGIVLKDGAESTLKTIK